MAYIPVKTRGLNKKAVIHILIVVLGILTGYIYYSQIIEPAKEPIILADIPKSDNLNKFKDARTFDFKFLTEIAFRSLKVFGEFPVQPGPTGKSDIFR